MAKDKQYSKHLAQTFKGNKANLPQKICQNCQKSMTWRAKWAKNWESVRYCSQRCRENRKKFE